MVKNYSLSPLQEVSDRVIPLFPYPFLLYMEKLSIHIAEQVSSHTWQPVQVTRNGPSISHLLFTDDVPLFVKAKSKQVRLIRDIFEQFSRVRVLKLTLRSLSVLLLLVFLLLSNRNSEKSLVFLSLVTWVNISWLSYG